MALTSMIQHIRAKQTSSKGQLASFEFKRNS